MPTHDKVKIDTDDLIMVTTGPGHAEDQRIVKVNEYGQRLRDLFEADRLDMLDHPNTESLIMTALVTYAGALFGEVVEVGSAPPMTEGALTAFLISNFRNGERLGKRHIQRVQENLAGPASPNDLAAFLDHMADLLRKEGKKS